VFRLHVRPCIRAWLHCDEQNDDLLYNRNFSKDLMPELTEDHWAESVNCSPGAGLYPGDLGSGGGANPAPESML